MRNPISFNPLLGFRGLLTLCLTAMTAVFAPASLGAPSEEAFYQQLLKLPQTDGYRPTRTFTIITDADNGNQLVADDDADLRFNLLWMQQFRPGYKTTRGGAAFGQIFRTYMKSAYKSYRDRNNGGMLSALPDENGSLPSSRFRGGEMDYGLKVTDDEVRIRIEYSY
jgi:hypothetical protein